jgi:hypothetical protein
MIRRLVTVVVFLSAAAVRVDAQPVRWFKGNTHTHTNNSDGDSTPDEVVKWYRDHGYHFVVMTDHNVLTSVDPLNAAHRVDQQFLVVKGEEVTLNTGGKSFHINGLDVDKKVEPQSGPSVVDILQRNVDAIRRENGIPHINHPNFLWSITRADLEAVKNNRLFEVFNGHPLVHNQGGGGVPGLEEVWDTILTNGTLLYGLAVDDAHYFKQPGNPDVPGPGRGWVYVRASRLEARALVESLERGDFYASTGVVLDDYQADTTRIAVSVNPASTFKYRIEFIGRGGRVLQEATEPTATYQIRGDEGYVRAKVIDSGGRIAWCQPIVVPVRLARVSAGEWQFLVAAAVLALVWRSRSVGSPIRSRRAAIREKA